MTTQERLMTADQFEAFCALPENHDRLLELINGEVVEKMPTEEHGALAARFVIKIGILLETHPIGRVFVEARYRPADDNYNARQPDVSFASDLSRPLVKRGSTSHIHDLAIEIKSPDDSNKLIRDKAAYYLANGARLVWLVYPQTRVIEVYTKDGVQILTVTDTLDGGDVLPGFTIKVADVFAGLG